MGGPVLDRELISFAAMQRPVKVLLKLNVTSKSKVCIQIRNLSDTLNIYLVTSVVCEWDRYVSKRKISII